MKQNRVKQMLAEGRLPVGHMIMEFGTRGIGKLLESAGVDFVVYDMEHSGFDMERIFDLIAWSKASPFAPFVRVPQGRYHFIARVMDAGALGVMVGNVETPEAAKSVVSAMKYAPVGKRGVALGVSHTDYLMPDASEYFRCVNEQSLVICQIESELGVRNADAIAAIPEVDVLWIGHYDLSQSMGIPAQFHHERYLEATRTVVDAARRHGKHLGIQPGSMEQAEEWMAMGFDIISWQNDIGVYRTALQTAVAGLRERAERA